MLVISSSPELVVFKAMRGEGSNRSASEAPEKGKKGADMAKFDILSAAYEESSLPAWFVQGDRQYNPEASCMYSGSATSLTSWHESSRPRLFITEMPSVRIAVYHPEGVSSDSARALERVIVHFLQKWGWDGSLPNQWLEYAEEGISVTLYRTDGVWSRGREEVSATEELLSLLRDMIS